VASDDCRRKLQHEATVPASSRSLSNVVGHKWSFPK
jgi:hypothetical protein